VQGFFPAYTLLKFAPLTTVSGEIEPPYDASKLLAEAACRAQPSHHLHHGATEGPATVCNTARDEAITEWHDHWMEVRRQPAYLLTLPTHPRATFPFVNGVSEFPRPIVTRLLTGHAFTGHRPFLPLIVSEVDKVNYRSVAVAGDVLVRDHLRSFVKVVYVDFEHGESQGDPVVTYLQHHGSTKSAPTPLATEYHLRSDSNPSLYRAPSTTLSKGLLGL
jgi:hypothetical protein